MVASLRAHEIDIAIGLTEGWVAGLGKKKVAQVEQAGEAEQPTQGGYKIVGTYVETPLCWAISTGPDREDVVDVTGLKGKKMGVSRIGRYECL